MTNIPLTGISFQELPYIEGGEECVVVWDQDNKHDAHAFSVRLEGCHIGWIPKVSTIKEEAIKARDGFKKVGRNKWKQIEPDKARMLSNMKMELCGVVEMVRDQIYLDFTRNHIEPRCTLSPLFYDSEEGWNYKAIGELRSISATFDMF